MQRKLLGALMSSVVVTLLLLALMPVMAIATHDTDPTIEDSTAQSNQESYWEGLGYGTCQKLDESGEGPVTLDDSENWTLLLFKQAQEDIYWENPIPGHPYYDGLEWSHLITCWGERTTTTSTTVPEETTTVPESTTTTEPLTTTTKPSTTTTVEDTTTTSVEATTTTTEATTTTTDPGDDELPFTGPTSSPLVLSGLAVMLLTSGLYFLRRGGRLTE